MKKIGSIIIFLLSIIPTAWTQDYFVQGNDTIVGIEIVKGSKSNHFRYVRFKSDKVITVFTPDLISEFGNDKKQIFRSKKNPNSKEDEMVFMELLLSKDSSDVYYYTDKGGSYFYLQNNGGELQEITTENNLLTELLSDACPECPPVRKGILERPIKLNRTSVMNVLELYNTCNPNLLTRFRYGIMAGTGIGIFSPDELPESFNDFSYFFGLFADIPLYKGLSLHPEIYYIKDAGTVENVWREQFTDYTFNREIIVLPLLVRYSFIKKTGKLIPYLQAGPVVDIGLRKEIDERTIIHTGNQISSSSKNMIDKGVYLYGGVSVGGGIEYKLNRTHSLFVDLRYSASFDKGVSNRTFITFAFNF